MNNHFVSRTVLAAILCAQALASSAAQRPDDPIPVGPQVKVGKLANGLTYYIMHNARPEHKLELRLIVKAGSALEDEDQQGLAHFTEHMAFNGSTHFKRNELFSYLESIGVKNGADLNAYTSFDETVYMLPIPTDRTENVATGFQVLEDWAHGLTLNPADIDKERNVVLEELRLNKGAGDRISKVTMPKIFNGSRYAERLPIGKEEILRSFKPEAIQRFYRDWYRPDLMAVVAVGDIEPAEAERLIKQHFSHIANPPHERPRQYAQIPQRQATEALVVTDKEAGGNSLLIRYPVRQVTITETWRSYREKVVRGLFEGMLGERLRELAQQSDPPFLAGASGVGKLTPRYESYTVRAALGPRGAVPAIAALVQENERARKFGFAAPELEIVKKNLLRSFDRAYNERDKTDSDTYVAEYMRNFLTGESLPGLEAEYRMMHELVPSITLDEVNAYARHAIPADAAKLVIYTGVDRAAEPAPQGAQLLAAVAAAEKAHVAARNEKAVAAHLMDAPPQAGNIVAESVDQALGTTQLTLSNGVKVVLKPTDFNNDQVLMSATRYGGQGLFDDKDISNARYANAIVENMGIKDMAPLDVNKVLAGKAASLHTSLGAYTDNVGGAAGASDVETMLQMAWLRFNGVRRDETLYKSFIGKQMEFARNREGQPAALFGDTVQSTLYGNHPRAPRALKPDEVAQLSLDRSIDIYRERFSSAKGMTFFIVGSFDLKTIKPLVATYLGSLPTPDLPLAYRDTGLRPVRGVVKREVHSGAEDKSTVSLYFTGPAQFSVLDEMRLSALMEVMNLRVFDVLRQQMGLIYGGGMQGSMTPIPYGHYSIAATLPTGPQNVDKVLAATFVEIDKIKRDGPDPADLDKVKLNWTQTYRKSLRENSFWLGGLQSALTEGTDPHVLVDFEKYIAGITPEDVKAAAQRYFNTENYVQVVLYPEKKDAGVIAASGSASVSKAD
ncbi:insulinase family protein [Massilia terrae]|uniref:Insulinase family protein n=1 Tax=Massilia terrae TaxID=1811224 RepID=A0ABT2D5P1_9BURK|nr:insulinase family protein [Massilia terrae]MCS0660668.1 insulinase family protein [Massilia terrae]